jgi:hypothetical protein
VAWRDATRAGIPVFGFTLTRPSIARYLSIPVTALQPDDVEVRCALRGNSARTAIMWCIDPDQCGALF